MEDKNTVLANGEGYDRDYVLFLSNQGKATEPLVSFHLPRDLAALFTSEQQSYPPPFTWHARVLLKDEQLWNKEGETEKRHLVVATDIPVDDVKSENKESFLPTPQVWYYDELLKSTIQKAVRRRKSWTGENTMLSSEFVSNSVIAAVRLAYQLMRQSMPKFLRRLPVILMEDAICHPRFLYLIWLMIANSKGSFLYNTCA